MLSKLNVARAALKHDGAIARPHTWITKLVHWFGVALIIFALVEDGGDTGALFRPDAMQFEVYIGLAVAAIYGFLWLWTRGPGGGSRLPVDAPGWERAISKIAHYGIYLTITAILLSGFAMAYFAPTDLVVDAPAERVLDMTARFSFARGAHENAVTLLGWFLFAHFSGALWHWYVRRDGVMQSISALPAANE